MSESEEFVRQENAQLCALGGHIWLLAPLSEEGAQPNGDLECGRCHASARAALLDARARITELEETLAVAGRATVARNDELNAQTSRIKELEADLQAWRDARDEGVYQ